MADLGSPVDTLTPDESALVDQIVELTLDRDGWRVLALEAIHYCADLTQQIEMIDRRRPVCRRRLREQRDPSRRRVDAA